jgi:hypothetical protein
MTEELKRAGYGGPWDPGNVVAAFARTTGGPVTVEGGASPLKPPAPPVDTAAEGKKIQALLPAITPVRNDTAALRSIWMKSGSALPFEEWLKLVKQALAAPPSFAQMAALLPK